MSESPQESENEYVFFSAGGGRGGASTGHERGGTFSWACVKKSWDE